MQKRKDDLMPLSRCIVRALIALAVLTFIASAQEMQVGESHIGVSGEMQLKWIGKGISDKTLDMEILFNQAMVADNSNFDGKFNYKTTAARLSLNFHPKNILNCKLSMPFLLKQGPDGKTGPFGDLTADISRSWGKGNRIITGITLGFPVGYSTIMQDDNDLTFLPPQLQPGSGLFSGAVRASYAFVPGWGIINIGASYWAGLFAVRTSEYGLAVDTVHTSSKILYDKKAFEFARDGWGARNDAGINQPDYLGIYADFGIKTETVNHGISIGYFYPAAPNKYDVYSKSTTSTPYPTKEAAQMSLDAGNTTNNVTYFVAGQQPWDSTWVYLKKTTMSQTAFPSLTLQYNIEKNDLTFPIFLGGMVKLDYNNRLNFGGFALGLGFKFPVY